MGRPPGAVTAALSRPAPWRRPDALTTWTALIEVVAGIAPDQLGPCLYLASLGARTVALDPYSMMC